MNSIKIILLMMIVGVGASSSVFAQFFPPDMQAGCNSNPGGSPDNKQFFNNQYGKLGDDPIQMTKGSLNFNSTDLSVPGPAPIVLTRYFDSYMGYAGPIGNNFDINLNRYVTCFFTDTETSAPILYNTGRGYKIQIGTVNLVDGTFLVPNYNCAYREHYSVTFTGTGGLVITDNHGNQDTTDSAGYVIKSVDKNGNELDYTRDGNENLLKVEDPVHGSYMMFSLDPTSNRISSVTDSAGRTVSYNYDTNGNLLQVTSPATDEYPTGTTFQYTYDSLNRLATEVDGNGNTVLTNTWGTAFEQYWTFSSPPTTEFEIPTVVVYADASGNPITTPNPVFINQIVSQTYNGHTCTLAYTYAPSYFPIACPTTCISNTDVRGYTTDYYNDQCGNITKQVVHTAGLHSGEPSTYETDYTYSTDGAFNKLSEKDPNGNGTNWTYDSNSNILTAEKISPSGATVDTSKGTQALTATTTYTYEPRFNQVASMTDPNGNETTYDYGNSTTDPGGNLLSVTYPTAAAGTATESYTYNSLGQMLTDTAPDGVVTQNTFDPSTGYLTQTVKDYGTGKLNATTQFTYDTYGHVATTTDANGHTTTITTDAQNNVTEIDGASSEVEQKSYDADGNLITDQKQSPGSAWEKTVSVYNSFEELTAVRQYTSATAYLETDYGYDNDANRISVTDPLGHETQTAYDERGKAYLTTDALGHTTKLDFDGNGNTVKLTDELSNVTTYAYDGLDKLEQKTFPDSSYQTWKYDSVGNLTGLRTTGGNTVSQTYDTRNRMLTQVYGSSTITNVYDIMGRLSTATEGGASLTYVYDDLGRNTSFTDQAGLVSTYSYDLVGNRTSTTYPSSVTVQRAHDASNRVTTLKDGSGSTQATYSYDILDRSTGMTLANSTSVAWNYDLLNRISSVDNTLQTGNRNYSYAYDNAGRRTSETEPRGTVSFGYTNRNEVNGVTEPSGSPFNDQSFAYDAGYNRSNWTNGSTSTDYTVNNLNQYTAVASATPSWNGDGGLASYNGNTYTYDALMRLTEVDNSLGKYLFSYDPIGRRVKKVIENTSGTVLETYSYHYDGSEVAVEYQPSATWTYYLGLGIDQPVMRVNGSTKQWYYANAQGSIGAVADNSGDLLEAYEYNAQGQFQVTNGSGTVETGTLISNYLLYTGRNYDFETGNYFYRARYYSPDLGRFISRDPLSGAEFSQGTNLYAYCRNNFLNANDPTGMSCIASDFKLDTSGVDPNSWLSTSPPPPSIEGPRENPEGADWILGALGMAAEGLIDVAAAAESMFGSAAADTSMTTVTHFTNAAGAAGIGDGGTLGAGQFVTTSNLSGLGATDVESALEVGAGKGAYSTTFQTPTSNLGAAFNGRLTSGGAYQFQLINPAQVTTFTPTP